MAKILVAEDHEQMRKVMQISLESAGHIVVEAADGREATEKLREAEFDLLITDILMPERDGLQMIMDLQRDRKEVPVIAITGMISQATLYLKIAKSLGASRVLEKPFTERRFLEAVSEVLRIANEDKEKPQTA